MKKTEEEIDALHDATIENLYEVFQEELDLYFKFKSISLDVLSCGIGTFPFSGTWDCSLEHIDKSLDVIERNIFHHIEDQLKILFEEKPKKSSYVCEHSERLKEEFSKKMRETIKDFLEKKY